MLVHAAVLTVVLTVEAAEMWCGLFLVAEAPEERVGRFSIAEAAEVRRGWFPMAEAAEVRRGWFSMSVAAEMRWRRFSIWYGGGWITMGYQVIDKLGVFNGVAAATISDATESFRATPPFAVAVSFGMTAPPHRWTGADIGDGFWYLVIGILQR